MMELNYWGSTLAKSASYDERAVEWRLVVGSDTPKAGIDTPVYGLQEVHHRR